MLSLWSSFVTLAVGGVVSQALVGDLQVEGGSMVQKYAPDQRGAVASENYICSNIGVELLERGGNAADAVGLLDKFATFTLTHADIGSACWHRLLRWRYWHVP